MAFSERTVVMNNRKAFTLIEMLIVLAIIALLVGILLPSITMVRKQAKETAQKAQFAAIDMALDAFKQDYGDYPPSKSNVYSFNYCGTQQLTEALLGMDLRGFNPDSVFRWDGLDAGLTRDLYGNATLPERRGPYLEAAKTGVFHLNIRNAGASDGLYDPANIPFFDSFFKRAMPNYVICDVFSVKKISLVTAVPTGGSAVTTKWAGTPILYYKANTASTIFSAVNQTGSIYNYQDNAGIVQLGKLPDGYIKGPPVIRNEHRLAVNPASATPGYTLYSREYGVVDARVPPTPAGTYWPNRPDSYILISAGADHEFGTKDDIFNF